MIVAAVAAVLIEATATVSVVAAACVRAVALAATVLLHHPPVEELDLVGAVDHRQVRRESDEKKNEVERRSERPLTDSSNGQMRSPQFGLW